MAHTNPIPSEFPLHLGWFVLIRTKNLVGEQPTWNLTLRNREAWNLNVISHEKK